MVMPVLWMMAAGVIVIVFMAITMLAARSVVVSVDGRMIVVVIVIMAVAVIMVVMMGLRGVALGLHIGAALGIERRLERDHAGPETHGHRLDDGVAADAQRLWHDFGRQMTVAEVPGDAGQGQWVCGPDLRQRFGLGEHFDHASVLEVQPIAAAQHCRFGEVEQEFEPADAGHGDTPAIALVEVEHHRIRRSARPMAGRDDFVSAQHLCTFRLGRPRHRRSGSAWSDFEREAKQTPVGL